MKLVYCTEELGFSVEIDACRITLTPVGHAVQWWPSQHNSICMLEHALQSQVGSGCQ